MRTTLIAALVGAATCAGAASAQPLRPTETLVQRADWYCGPECQRHRYWEHRRWERERWQESHWRYRNPYYGYNYTYPYGYR
jgi:hypothetical protein